MNFLSGSAGKLAAMTVVCMSLHARFVAARLLVDPVSLTGAAMYQTLPEEQDLVLGNNSPGTQVVYGASVTAGGAWLSLTDADGELEYGEAATIGVVYRPAAAHLEVGQYSGMITITNLLVNAADTNIHAAGPTREVPVLLDVKPQPRLWVSTVSITNVASEGQDAPARQFQVRNDSASYELRYHISDDVPWAAADVISGVSTGEHDVITVHYSTAGMDVGVYNGTLVVSAEEPVDGPGMHAISLRLEITAKAGLGSDAVPLAWTARLGDAPSSRSFKIWNTSTGPDTMLRWDVAPMSDLPWISVAPASGTLGDGLATVTVVCDPAGLRPGHYEGVLRIDASDVLTGEEARDAPVDVRVSLDLRAGDSLDFGGMGRSALVIYGLDDGMWGFRDLEGASAWDWLGQAAFIPVPGDYTGDGMAELAVYRPASGNWYWKAFGSGDITMLGHWGGPDYLPVAGDYDGDGRQDFVLYHETSGAWYALLSASGYQPVELAFGGPGWRPVSGDFDGDGKADPVIYHEATGRWQALLSGVGYRLAEGVFGGPGFAPMSGDFNGDGRSDLGIYHPDGLWYLLTAESRWLLHGAWWGGAGYDPVIGDYDGDGRDDLAVYERATGRWRIRKVNGTILAWDLSWGGHGYIPVGR